MEYVVRSGDSFEQIEMRVIDTLQRQGFVVRQSFSLLSATRSVSGLSVEERAADGPPGFSVLWLYGPGASRQPHSLVTLYQRRGHTLFRAVPSPMTRLPLAGIQATADLEAELVATLVLDGLDVCLGLGGDRRCVDAAQLVDSATPGPDAS
ncbi:MAG: hypothetical protein M8467_10690 [Anaerolineae bacterium]|nr:hypothetical protein [Anaerolineae bacterium]